MKPQKVPLTLYEGTTLKKVFRWGQSTKTYELVQGMTVTAPVRVNIPSHSVEDGWPVWLESVEGPDELNQDSTKDTPYIASVVDTDNIDLVNTNGLGLSAYQDSGAIVYHPPVDLTGYTARMQIKNSVDDVTALFDWDSAGGELTIDPKGKITLSVDPAVLTDIGFTEGVYDLELESSGGEVSRIAFGPIAVSQEVTT